MFKSFGAASQGVVQKQEQFQNVREAIDLAKRDGNTQAIEAGNRILMRLTSGGNQNYSGKEDADIINNYLRSKAV